MQNAAFAALIVFQFNVLASSYTIFKAVQWLFLYGCAYIFFSLLGFEDREQTEWDTCMSAV